MFNLNFSANVVNVLNYRRMHGDEPVFIPVFSVFYSPNHAIPLVFMPDYLLEFAKCSYFFIPFIS